MAVGATVVLGAGAAVERLEAQVRAPRVALATTPDCASCAGWNAPQAPFRVFGNTYYVGTRGLTALLVTGASGHVLLDGGLQESAPLIAASIRALGFRLEDVKLIVTSHTHYDHVGGVAELQRASGADVAALAPAARTLRTGRSGTDDPQFGTLAPFAPVARVRAVADREVLRVGALALTAHQTAGHTPGGTTWSWESCEGERCADMVYADSQSPISSPDFRYGASRTWPTVLADFRAGHERLDGLRCDILVTPHPEASGLWSRLDARTRGDTWALFDREACRRYAASARERLAARLVAEDTMPRRPTR